jgi:hypothetical protein
MELEDKKNQVYVDCLIHLDKSAEELAIALNNDESALSYAADKLIKLYKIEKAIDLIKFGANAEVVIFRLSVINPELIPKAKKQKYLFFKNRYLKNPVEWENKRNIYRNYLEKVKSKSGSPLFNFVEIEAILREQGWSDNVRL